MSKRDRIQQVQCVSVIVVDHLEDLISGNFKRPESPLMVARTRVKPNPVIDPSPPGTVALPDNLIMVNPTVVYRPSDKKYLMYFKGYFTGAAPGLAVMISRDGINWEMHPERVFAPRELPLSDGTSIPLANMERPQFLINDQGEPVAFYTACSIGPCGPKTDGSTFNAQFGIKIHYIVRPRI